MVLSDPAKSVLESAWLHVLMETITRTKTKHYHYENKVCYFFRAVYHSKNHMIPHPIIAAILDVILNI